MNAWTSRSACWLRKIPAAAAERNVGASRPQLGLAALVAVLFFCVSGGPFGLEGLVGSVGPGMALLLLVATPILYSVPEALLVGELASMLPLEGGYYEWVKRAFGGFWGFWNGWLSWAYSLVDMAIYPLLFIQYVGFFAPGMSRWGSWSLALVIIWGAAAINLSGARVVGMLSRWFVAGVLLPFGVLSVIAAARWFSRGAPLPTTPFHAPGTTFLGALGLGISQSIWNYSGWDNASTVGGEIADAGRNYPKALARSLTLVTLAYLASIVPALAVTPWQQWTDGAWPAIATQVAGSWLGTWLAIAGMVSALALFNALLMAYSRIPMVMARDGLLPAALGRADVRGTPRFAIVVSAACYSLFALLSFGGLLAADVLLYSAALTLEFAALIQLRRKEPGLRGPFRVPVPTVWLIPIAAVPILFLLTGVVLEVQSPDVGLPGVLVAAGLGLLGPLFWFGGLRRRVAG